MLQVKNKHIRVVLDLCLRLNCRQQQEHVSMKNILIRSIVLFKFCHDAQVHTVHPCKQSQYCLSKMLDQCYLILFSMSFWFFIQFKGTYSQLFLVQLITQHCVYVQFWQLCRRQVWLVAYYLAGNWTFHTSDSSFWGKSLCKISHSFMCEFAFLV